MARSLNLAWRAAPREFVLTGALQLLGAVSGGVILILVKRLLDTVLAAVHTQDLGPVLGWITALGLLLLLTTFAGQVQMTQSVLGLISSAAGVASLLFAIIVVVPVLVPVLVLGSVPVLLLSARGSHELFEFSFNLVPRSSPHVCEPDPHPPRSCPRGHLVRPLRLAGQPLAPASR